MLNKFKKCKTVNDLFELISIDKIELFSLISLIIFMFSPIIFNLVDVLNDSIHTIWYRTIMIIGVFNIFLFIIYLKKKIMFKEILKFTPFLLWILYLIWCIIPNVLSNDKLESFLGNTYLRNGYFSYIAYTGYMFAGMIIQSKKNMTRFCKCFLISLLIICILPFIQYGKNMGIVDFSGVFFNSNHFAYYLVIGVIVSMLLYTYERKKFYLIVYIISLFTLIYNNTFGGYLALLGTLILIVIYNILNKKNIKATLIVTFIFILLSLFTFKNSNYIAVNNIKGLFSDTKTIAESINDKNIDASKAGTNRWGLWITTLELVKRKPIFGYGIANLGAGYDELKVYPESIEPHNVIIRTSAENGIIAVLLYLAMLLTLFINLLRNNKKLDFITIIFSFAVIGYFASSLFGVSVFNAVPYYFICLGIVMGRTYMCKQKV